MRQALHEKIERILPLVSRPARYTGGEWNAVRKEHATVSLKVAWAFPDSYEVGMSHLGSLIMYDQINKRSDAVCERTYTPWPDMEQRMQEEGIGLFTLESWTPVREFDILAFPLLYELTYTNLFTCLRLAGLPFHASERKDEDPLVIAGGPSVFNCEPLAPFLDVAVLGDGEQVIHEILDVYGAWKSGGKRDRRELLRQMARIPGCYVPAFYAVDYRDDGTIERYRVTEPGVPATVERAIVKDLDEVEFPTAPIVPNVEVIFERAQVEVFRGCTRGCRFCHAGMVTRPVRERSPEKVQQMAREIVRNTGYNDLSLVSLSSADYTDIRNTVELLSTELQCTGVNVSLPSTRVDAFSVALADAVSKVRKGSITLAPEGGSARIRRVINKNLADRDIRSAFRAAFESGYRSIKLYFMLGLPTETDADLAAIAEQGRWALEIAEEVLGRQEARGVRVTISVSVFVPKNHTPFQFEAQPEQAELRRRIQYIKRCLKDRRIEYKHHDAESSHLEAMLSLGDRRIAATLLKAWEMGARFDGWNDHFNYELWMKACEETGTDIRSYAHRKRGYGETLAWDHLSSGITREWLIEEHQRAMNELEVEDCRWENCDACGACMESDVQPVLKPAGPPTCVREEKREGTG